MMKKQDIFLNKQSNIILKVVNTIQVVRTLNENF